MDGSKGIGEMKAETECEDMYEKNYENLGSGR
jgi:hypothetical protein